AYPSQTSISMGNDTKEYLPCMLARPARHRPYRLLIRRSQHAALRDDRRHQLRRRHVERGVVDVDPVGGGLFAQAVRHLARVALFDWDLLAAGERHVDAARRGGDVERDAEVL